MLGLRTGLDYYLPVFYFDIMRISSPLRGGLLFIECARFSYLTGILAILRHNAGTSFPWQIYAVPNALFLLIALFLWLDAARYGVFSLLYISGKSLCLFSEIAGGIVFLKNMGPVSLFESGITGPGMVIPVVFIIDVITVILIMISTTKNKKAEPVLSESAPYIAAQDDNAGGHGGA